MTDSPFRGVIPPVVIPLTEKRQLDLEALERSINRMIDAGVDGLFFLGSSGEVAFLTDAQRYHVLQEAIAMVHGRVPVLTGIIDMETMRVVDQAKRATGYGVDALVATAPFYALGGPKEVERHFRAIREHTDLPLFAYDLPACVHTKLDPTMLVRLGEDGVLQGVKDSSGGRRVVPLAAAGERGCGASAAAAHRPRGMRGRRIPRRCGRRRAGTREPRARRATWSSGARRRPATGSECATSRTTWPALCS